MASSNKKATTGKIKSKSRQTTKKFNRSRRINTLAVVVVIVLAGFILLAGGIILSAKAQPAAQLEGLETFKNLDRGHTTAPVTYAQIPPVGGQHDSEWLNCGVYTEPVRNENAVHSLEHGAVWITYQPDLPAAEVQKLQEITRQGSYRILSPYPGLPSPIVVSAWGFQLKLQKADDARLNAFIKKYEQYPLGPEPGASCTGGTGEPLK